MKIGEEIVWVLLINFETVWNMEQTIKTFQERKERAKKQSFYKFQTSLMDVPKLVWTIKWDSDLE